MGKRIKQTISLVIVLIFLASILVGCITIQQPNDQNQGNNGDNGNQSSNNGDSSVNGSTGCSHGEILIDAAVAPTHNSTGLTEGSHCAICGQVIREQQVIPKLEIGYYYIVYNNLKGADIPSPDSYAENIGVSQKDMPKLSAPGYKFLGWYTASTGGEPVDYIPKGSQKDYILYAHWEKESYSITYVDAFVNSNVTTYTVEDEIILSDPNWSGLAFSHWENENGDTVKKIEQGSTGNIVLTANWISLKNWAIPSNNDKNPMVIYNEENERYHFIIELGTINNVFLGELCESKGKLFGESLTLSASETVGFDKSITESVAKTVSQSVMKSKEWSEMSEWATKNSASISSGISSEIGASLDGITAKVEASLNVTNTSESSRSNSTVESKGEDIGNEESYSTSSTVSYNDSISTTITVSRTFPETMPEGTYSLAYVGKVYVYAIVTYSHETKEYFLDVFSYMDDSIIELPLYDPPAQSQANIKSNDTLAYNIDSEELETYVASAYYVEYDANGGEGIMPMSAFKEGEKHNLYPNSFTKTGYSFSGWELRTENGTKEYTDTESVCDIAAKGEIITLYAKWTPIVYNITYDSNGGVFIDEYVYPSTYTVEDLPLDIPGLAYKEYSDYNHFIEWQEKGMAMTDDLASNPRDLVLTAHWDLCTVYTEMASTTHTVDNRVIIDWRNETANNFSAVTGNSIITVNNTASELILIGNSDVVYSNIAINFAGAEENQEFTLRLIDFNFITNQSDAIKPVGTDNGMILNVEILGNCSIGTTYAGGSIITGFTNTVNLTGDGEMIITAGNGASGSGDGGKGGAAIVVTNIVITMNGKLNVYGGNGGNAYDRPSGDNSGNCSNGRNGYIGGSGGDAFSVENLTIVSGTCLIVGGNGGKGGNASEGNDCIWHTHYGGSGGVGGSGGNAINAAILTVNDGGDVTATGGNGGNGGTRGGMHKEGAENAGAQGDGGAYGYAITSYCTQNVSENATTVINNGTSGSEGTGTNWC